MRKNTIADLGENRHAVVLEMRMCDIRRAVERLHSLAEVPIADLLRCHLPELLALAADSLKLPPETTVDDLSVSEIMSIKDAWWGMHRDFLTPVIEFVQARLAVTRASPSIEPV